MSLRTPAVLLLSAFAALSGCTYTKDAAIRVKPDVEAQPPSTVAYDRPTPASLTASPYEKVTFTTEGDALSYDLYTIEQDDRGVLFQRDQIDTVRSRILASAKTDTHRGAIIVVFVHGWKHNATPCDDNLSCFRAVLRHITEDEREKTQPGMKPRRVAGVYVAWRGLSACDWTGKQVSFYQRKNAAHRVGTAQTREVLQNLRDVHEELRNDSDLRGVRTRLVIVGHSFGAALVHSAVVTDMLQALYTAKTKVNANGSLPAIDGYGDLVVLVNPAFEAQLFDPFPREARKIVSRGQTFAKQRPVYVVVSSVGDVATHYFFPLGQSFSLALQPLRLIRGPASWYRHLTTAGNHFRYRTHAARRIGDPLAARAAGRKDATKAEREQSNCFQGALDETFTADCSCSQDTFAPHEEVSARATAALAKAPNAQIYGHVLLEPYERWNNSPYWVIKAQKNVVKDHGDVFNPIFVSLLHDLVVEGDPRLESLRYAQ